MGVILMMEHNEPFPIEKSDYYKFYLLENAEIEKHKWFLSENLHKDCGISYARWDWVMRFRDEWIENLESSGYFSGNFRPNH